MGSEMCIRDRLEVDCHILTASTPNVRNLDLALEKAQVRPQHRTCLLYTSDAADERSSVDLGGRRIIKKKEEKYLDEFLVNIDNKRRREATRRMR